jgi:hypothetical protein
MILITITQAGMFDAKRWEEWKNEDEEELVKTIIVE